MSLLQRFLCFCFALLMCFQSGLAHCKGNWNRKIKNNEAGTYDTILVDHSGHGNFSTIQQAINSISTDNRNWVCIYIKAGTYREKVKIPDDKPYIIMKGEGKKKTRVVWGDHDSVAQSPTFMSSADNIVVKGISFVNSYNSPKNKDNHRAPAVAAMITGDKCAFYRCGFYGVQDTLWDDQGRHYFKKCTIQGAVDFIFGSGQSIYEGCSIQVLGKSLETGLSGFITAQGRTNPNDANGFVFKGCTVFGYGSAYLGRPWRSYSRVLFYDSNLTNVVMPEGWDASNFIKYEDRLSFAEHGNYGPGANTAQRVRWEKKLSMDEVKQLTSMSFIDSDGWIERQPF